MSSFTQLGPDFDGEGADARNGSSVSLSSDGTIVALGALGSNHVRLYQWNSETVSWNQLGADIDGDTVLDKFGHQSAFRTYEKSQTDVYKQNLMYLDKTPRKETLLSIGPLRLILSLALFWETFRSE